VASLKNFSHSAPSGKSDLSTGNSPDQKDNFKPSIFFLILSGIEKLGLRNNCFLISMGTSLISNESFQNISRYSSRFLSDKTRSTISMLVSSHIFLSICHCPRTFKLSVSLIAGSIFSNIPLALVQGGGAFLSSSIAF